MLINESHANLRITNEDTLHFIRILADLYLFADSHHSYD